RPERTFLILARIAKLDGAGFKYLSYLKIKKRVENFSPRGILRHRNREIWEMNKIFTVISAAMLILISQTAVEGDPAGKKETR
ncbi:hypothetical protein QUF80_23335, partial [Desulfococcaceae bacterium HSG8]|nr:hypothetical protein [Desulfococcaceae bacterium HSG8]